jgi:hypothetical protein
VRAPPLLPTDTYLIQQHTVDPLTVFDLSIHPNLKTLSIHDRSWADPEEFDDKHLIPFVTKLAAPTLEVVSFHLDLTLYRALDWSPLDAFFSPARFPSLARVAFVHSAPQDVEFLRKALPLLSASGVMRVEL